jgi:uncharacterized protein
MARTNSLSILVFARAPQPGVAKTRLVPLLGPEGAAALHARLIKHTLSTVRRAAPHVLELHGTPEDDPFLRYCAARYGAPLVAQIDGDLGARMGHAVENALTRAQGVLVIGTDCPSLTARHLAQAAQALARGQEAVLIPTEDGGYALLGLTRFDERLFTAVPWGTDSVMSTTRIRLAALGWTWSELDTLWDIDRPADVHRLLATGLLDRATAQPEEGGTGGPAGSRNGTPEGTPGRADGQRGWPGGR